MGICHRGPTASMPKEPALHAFLRSYLQLSMAVPTDGRQGSSTCERISGRPYMSSSVPCLFEVAYGHLSRRPNREQAQRAGAARVSTFAHHCLLPTTVQPMAVPTEAKGDLYANDSLPWLFEVGYGHLPPWQEVKREEILMKLDKGTAFSTFFYTQQRGYDKPKIEGK